MLRTHSRHPGRRRGFTLIELIVAIVVLGILATLAIVGFRATIDRSTDAKQRARTQSVLREARTLYVQKIYQDPSYTWQKAIIDATADLPTFRTNALTEGVSATGGDNLNTATNGWTLESDTGSLVYSSVSSELVFKVQSSTLYVASYSEATGSGVFGYVSQETPPVVWVAGCSVSSCDAESATLGTPAGGAYAPGTTASLLPTLSYSSTAFSLSGSSQALSATTTGSPTSFSYTGTLPAGVTFSTTTGTFTGPSLFGVDVTKVIAGGQHSCAITTAGGVRCWGHNYNGQIGNGSTNTAATAVQVTGLTSGVTALATGGYHTCAVVSGAAKCWGWNVFGELGDGSGTDRTTPVQVSGLTSGVTGIAVGDYHSCALLTGGAVKCWGYNSRGQLGIGSTASSSTPATVVLAASATKIAVGAEHTCALLSTGAVQCWGYNADGQIGDGSTTNRTSPTQVTGLTSGVAEIDAGSYGSCAVLTSGAAQCWGQNNWYQLLDGTFTAKSTPTQLSGLTSGVSKIQVGSIRMCVLLTNGTVKCWGASPVGDGTNNAQSVPTLVTGLSGISELSVGNNHVCVVTAATAKCWGDGQNFRIGDGASSNRTIPTQAVGTGPVTGFPAAITITATGPTGSGTASVTLTTS